MSNFCKKWKNKLKQCCEYWFKNACKTACKNAKPTKSSSWKRNQKSYHFQYQFQICLKLLLILLLGLSTSTSSSSSSMSSSHLMPGSRLEITSHNGPHPIKTSDPSLLLSGPENLLSHTPPSVSNFTLNLRNGHGHSVNDTFLRIKKTRSSWPILPSKTSKSQKNVQKSAKKKTTKLAKSAENDDKNDADSSVPVVPIQLPPPNATLQYHYTDEENLHSFKADFSRILLPFRATRKDVANPGHYREDRENADNYQDNRAYQNGIFYQDFLPEEMNDDDGLDEFNLFTGGGFGQGDQIPEESSITAFRDGFEHHFNTDLDSFLAKNHKNKAVNHRNSSSTSFPTRKIATKKIKIKQKIPQKFHKNHANFLPDHDYNYPPQISHDDHHHNNAAAAAGNNDGDDGNKRLKKSRKNQHNYELQNKNNKNSGDKSDSLLKSRQNKVLAKSAKSELDSDEFDEIEEVFEPKKILQKQSKDKFLSKNAKITSANNFTEGNSIPGSSLEDVSLSLNFDNGGSGGGGEFDEFSTSSKMRRRPRRSVVHLYDMVVCATGCNPLAYKGYGCYCGFLGSGLTVDGIDRCCAKHDWCYHHAKCPPFLTYFVPYYWTCNEGRPRCVTEYRGWKGVCGANLCECDRQFAQCLRKFPCPRSRAMCMTSPWRNLPIGPNFVFLA